MTDEIEVKKSPLCRDIEADGKSVRVEIYEDGAGAWLLEIVDEYNNSTCWGDSFASDQAALDEALDTVAQEGIDSLIGPESGQLSWGAAE